MNIIKQTLLNNALCMYIVYYAHRYLVCQLDSSIKAGFQKNYLHNY